jgi:cyclophilin family peptidyl-prolyl cis-trans isomerase
VTATTPATSASSSWSGTPWDPAARRDDLAIELGRRATPPTTDDVERWRTYARIGPVDAAAVFVDRLAGRDASPAELAAIGLLEPLPGRPGEAVEPAGAWITLERELWTRYAVAESDAQRRGLAFAIARVGGSTSARLWATAIVDDTTATPRADVLDALTIACARRHPLHADVLAPLGLAIESADPRARAAAIGAFGRCIAPSAEVIGERGPWVARLVSAAASDDADVARLSWKALAALGEPVAMPQWVLGPTPPASWLVELEAVRALAGHASTRDAVLERLVALPADAIVDTRAVTVWAALASLRRAVDEAPEKLAALARWRASLVAATPRDGRHARALAIVGCEIDLLRVVAGEALTTVERCARDVEGLEPHYGEVLAIDALVAMNRADKASVRAQALVDRAKDHRPPVAAAALAALADVEHAEVNAVLRDALVRADIGVLAAAAGAIAARAPDRARRDPEAVSALETVVRAADPVAAMEGRIAAVEALGALSRSAGEDVGDGTAATPKLSSPQAGRAWLERTVLPLASDPHEAVRRAAWAALIGHDDLQRQFLERITPASQPFAAAVLDAANAATTATGLRMHTDAGLVDIRFADAPAIVAQRSLVALARSGYFDGLRFHRVVPGFVVQGGDPRGDGYGGPGWVMPCEWSDLRFERGTVGIALAGKDTGGSQIFVAQTRQPHLDGRFTVVGHVEVGLDVVDRMLPQDRILRVEVIDGAAP